MTTKEREVFDKYYKDAKEKIKDEDVPEDEYGMLYYRASCLRLDCLTHDNFATDKIEPIIGFSARKELQTAAICEVIMEILLERDKKIYGLAAI